MFGRSLFGYIVLGYCRVRSKASTYMTNHKIERKSWFITSSGHATLDSVNARDVSSVNVLVMPNIWSAISSK